ncbi:hypothetical protein GJ699_00345 [Duganella sp. FT80W]|uniref:Uncharacterized protein n=1 Tax=Duganella guangzhouensis TaxID=2666084 RepID=A0A6I2KS54_9BURK|nr:hypothetical protein [Duganella guangzhouensis]MRW88433.1 hypothetical protein [Duganella guangzhouensis]
MSSDKIAMALARKEYADASKKWNDADLKFSCCIRDAAGWDDMRQASESLETATRRVQSSLTGLLKLGYPISNLPLYRLIRERD